MKKNTGLTKIIEINDLNLEAFAEGFELLALNKQLYPKQLTPSNLISIHNNGADQEPYSWLRDIMRFILLPHIEVIGQSVLKNYDELMTFIESLDEPQEYEFTESLLQEINNYSCDHYYSFDDIDESILNEFISFNNIRVSTIASTLFDTNFDFMIDLEDSLPFLTGYYLDLECDCFDMTCINNCGLEAYHPTSEYAFSFSIITYTSNGSHSYNLFDSIYEGPGRPIYLDSFKEAYKDLLDM